MSRYLENTISALCYELAEQHRAIATGSDGPCAPYNDVERFVLEQLERMPPFLALAIRMATMFFGGSRLLLEGSCFYRSPSSRRRLQVEGWKRSRLSPCQDLMKFYASLVALALYSRPEADRSRKILL